jgi:hypothetical protein
LPGPSADVARRADLLIVRGGREHPAQRSALHGGSKWQASTVSGSLRGRKTLEHPGGTPETNRANAVQIEICEHAADARSWDDNWYKAIANVLLLAQHHVGYPISRPRQFLVPVRFTGSGWIKAKGIVGHCHAPNQPKQHKDPGRIKAGKLLGYMKAGRQELRPR